MNTRKLKMNRRRRKKKIDGEKSCHMRDEYRNVRNNVNVEKNNEN